MNLRQKEINVQEIQDKTCGLLIQGRTHYFIVIVKYRTAVYFKGH